MPLAWISTWAVGIINGYQHKENRLPASYKYGIISLASGLNIIKALGRQSIPIANPNSLLIGLFVGIPFIAGSMFCTGNMLGKSIRHLSDMEEDKKLKLKTMPHCE